MSLGTDTFFSWWWEEIKAIFVKELVRVCLYWKVIRRHWRKVWCIQQRVRPRVPLLSLVSRPSSERDKQDRIVQNPRRSNNSNNHCLCLRSKTTASSGLFLSLPLSLDTYVYYLPPITHSWLSVVQEMTNNEEQVNQEDCDTNGFCSVGSLGLFTAMSSHQRLFTRNSWRMSVQMESVSNSLSPS